MTNKCQTTLWSWVNRRDSNKAKANGLFACCKLGGESQLVLTKPLLCLRIWQLGISSLQVNYEENVCGWEISWWLYETGRLSFLQTWRWQRLIDRPIRPMFAEGFRNEVQVITTVLFLRWNASATNGCHVGFIITIYLRYSVWRTVGASRLCWYEHQPNARN